MKYSLIVLLLLVKSTILCQTLTYDAFLKDQKVGQMVVNREISDNKTTIKAQTIIKAHMIFTIKVDINTQSTYINDILTESESVSKQNGHIHSSVQVYKTNSGYTINNNGDKTTLNSSGLIGADMLYFEAPQHIGHTLALASGQYLEIQKGAQDEYYFEHDGKKERHQYTPSGVLQQVVIDHQLYTVILKLQQTAQTDKK